MTQMILAEKSDLSVGYLCDLEAGNKWGTPETIAKVANALNVKPFQLFVEDDEKKPDSITVDLLAFSTQLKKSIDFEINNLLKKYS